MEIAPASKRKRVNEGSNPEAIVRSATWKPYGDIVLQAEFTQFRVSRDLLSSQSTVFDDMFSVAQPSSAEDPNASVEGCPLVVLAGDTARDWELLLELLYAPYKYSDQMPLEMLQTMFKLASKYEMGGVRQQAASLFHFEFPTQRDAFERRRRDSYGPWESERIKFEKYLEVQLLELAYKYGIQTSLPTLGLLCLKRYSLDWLLGDRCTRSDKSRVILDSGLKQMLAIAWDRMLIRQTDLFEWLDALSYDSPSIPADDCVQRNICKDRRNKVHRAIFRRRCRDRVLLLSTWDMANDEDFDPAMDFCALCETVARDEWERDMEVAWKALPGFFDLPKWAELKDVE
ncbi:BTB domain-containing protein [Mycena kentingensis (nom. inval.)]|nr:BTB domain-containing protein [Mycena kentingensis (nom. inval.)]